MTTIRKISTNPIKIMTRSTNSIGIGISNNNNISTIVTPVNPNMTKSNSNSNSNEFHEIQNLNASIQPTSSASSSSSSIIPSASSSSSSQLINTNGLSISAISAITANKINGINGINTNPITLNSNENRKDSNNSADSNHIGSDVSSNDSESKSKKTAKKGKSKTTSMSRVNPKPPAISSARASTSNLDIMSSSRMAIASNSSNSTYEHDSDAVIFAEFSDGYSFIKLLSFLKCDNFKNTTGECVFHFSAEGIRYRQSNIDKTVFHDLEIDASELTHYEFQSKNSKIIISLNLEQLIAILKIARKDGFQLLKQAQNNVIYIRPITGGTAQNFSFIIPNHIPDLTVYEEHNYNRSERQPNCTVSVSSFVMMCNQMTSIKPLNITVKGYEKGIMFMANTSAGITGKQITFGSPSEAEMGNINVPTKMLKAFSKISFISQNGTIKILFDGSDQDAIIKLVCHVGNYGILRTFIRNSAGSKK